MDTIVKLSRAEIDEAKWDNCVQSAANGVVFAYVWFLDITCDKWEGIVYNDYEAVMPIPIKKYWLCPVVELPWWIPHLGIVSQKPLSVDVNTRIIKTISHFNVALTLNAHNKLSKRHFKSGNITSYYVLDLILDLPKMRKDFSCNIDDVIERYTAKKVNVIRSLNPKEYIDFANKHGELTNNEQQSLIQLISFALRYKSAGTYAVYDERNEMLGQAFFLKSNKSIVLLHSVCKQCDTEKVGSKAIIYHILKNNAGSNLTMEFPFHPEIGQCFCFTEHKCIEYKKGLLRYL